MLRALVFREMVPVAQEAVVTITTLSSREFNQDTGKAKKAAHEGPVFITDRGEPSHVLLTMDEYRRLTSGGPNIVELLAFDGEVDDDAFEAILDGSRQGVLARPAIFD